MLCAGPEVPNHPGALIVTKFRSEANKIADGINKISQQDIARPWHTGAPLEGKSPASIPVLVTTHEAYRMALQELAYSDGGSRWERLRKYECGNRQWLIIDEAFDWTDRYSLTLGGIRSMAGDLRGVLPDSLQADALKLHDLAADLTDREQRGSAERLLTGAQLGMLANISIAEIAEAVSQIHPEVFTDMVRIERADAEQEDGKEQKQTPSKIHYLRLLGELQAIAQIGSAWVSRRRGKSCLNASRSLFDISDMKGVILDATASLDRSYELHNDKVCVLDRPANIRRYDNVTLHISTGHSVGKDYLAKHAAEEWSIVWGDLKKRLDGKNVLVCAHKDVLPILNGHELPTGTVQFTNWGKIDGRNDWNTCDAIVLFGLPYPDTVTPAQTYFAASGSQSESWFQGERKHGSHADIRAALNDGSIARSVVQALNRAQCRNVIDVHGNCEPTDAYILLPNGRTGEHILRAILEQMPGVKTNVWDAKGAKRKARKRPTEDRLISHFQMADPGIYLKSDVVEAIGTNPRTFERTTRKLLDSESALTVALAENGVRYSTTTGRGKEAFFTKH